MDICTIPFCLQLKIAKFGHQSTSKFLVSDEVKGMSITMTMTKGRDKN